MLLRVLFLLLLAANVGTAAWIYLSPPPPPPVPPPAADPGVRRLALLSELEPQRPESEAQELATAPTTPEEEARDRCARLGPFVTQVDLRRAMNALTPQVKRIQYAEDRQRQSRGFLVYLPAPATREDALALARRLSTSGVRDYYVVTAGDQQNSISLGLFKARTNAEKRQADLRGLGFETEISERADELPNYWLDYAVAPDATLNWRDQLPDLLDVNEQLVPCA
jgi:hypothetical protein